MGISKLPLVAMTDQNIFQSNNPSDYTNLLQQNPSDKGVFILASLCIVWQKWTLFPLCGLASADSQYDDGMNGPLGLTKCLIGVTWTKCKCRVCFFIFFISTILSKNNPICLFWDLFPSILQKKSPKNFVFPYRIRVGWVTPRKQILLPYWHDSSCWNNLKPHNLFSYKYNHWFHEENESSQKTWHVHWML